MKVFLLGLDGMTLKIVEPYVKANLLPNFKKIIDSYSYGTLRSTIPPVTPPGWISLATGKNPGKHGVYEFSKRKGYKTELVTKNTSPNAEPLWNILSRNGKKVMVINIPLTYPPDEINGIMVSGMMTPGVDTEFTFPKGMKEELLKLVPDYQIDADYKKFIFSGDKNILLHEIFKITEDGRKVMNYFLHKYPWDLFYFGFIGPDRLQHFLWDEILNMDEGCVRFYKLLDDILADILGTIDNDTVLFVVSDHGFKEAKKGLYINNFLNEIGLLEFKGKWKTRNEKSMINITNDIMNIANKMGLFALNKYLPSKLIRFFKKVLPKGVLNEDKIDWEKTRVFSLVGYGVVSINLKGREENGIVEKEEYKSICETVKKEFLALRDPETGEPVVKDVITCKEIYPSETSADAPDLLVVVHDGYMIHVEVGEKTISENKLVNLKVVADHEIDGLFIACGEIIQNKQIDADIYDVMPTILYLLGTPVPEDVDGRVLTEILDPDFLAKHKITYEKGNKASPVENELGEEETDELRRQLKNLGYMG